MEIVAAFWGLSVARGEGLNPLCPLLLATSWYKSTSKV